MCLVFLSVACLSKPQVNVTAGVRSRPEMITRLGAGIPRDIRRAVEGGLKGWHRLRRFGAAMAFPTIETAAAHLGAHQSALVHQFRRLERDIGARLYYRSTPSQPMRPTRRGTALLLVFSRPDIRALAAAQAPEQRLCGPPAHGGRHADRGRAEPSRSADRNRPATDGMPRKPGSPGTTVRVCDLASG